MQHHALVDGAHDRQEVRQLGGCNASRRSFRGNYDGSDWHWVRGRKIGLDNGLDSVGLSRPIGSNSGGVWTYARN